jgi:hypothetical protein
MVLKELYQYQENGTYIYRNVLAAAVALIDPSVETAKEAYIALRSQSLQNREPIQFSTALPRAEFFITVPNSDASIVQLQPDGWFTYAYKYGRVCGEKRDDVRYVPFDRINVSEATYKRIQISLPTVHMLLSLTP